MRTTRECACNINRQRSSMHRYIIDTHMCITDVHVQIPCIWTNQKNGRHAWHWCHINWNKNKVVPMTCTLTLSYLKYSISITTYLCVFTCPILICAINVGDSLSHAQTWTYICKNKRWYVYTHAYTRTGRDNTITRNALLQQEHQIRTQAQQMYIRTHIHIHTGSDTSHIVNALFEKSHHVSI